MARATAARLGPVRNSPTAWPRSPNVRTQRPSSNESTCTLELLQSVTRMSTPEGAMTTSNGLFKQPIKDDFWLMCPTLHRTAPCRSKHCNRFNDGSTTTCEMTHRTPPLTHATPKTDGGDVRHSHQSGPTIMIGKSCHEGKTQTSWKTQCRVNDPTCKQNRRFGETTTSCTRSPESAQHTADGNENLGLDRSDLDSHTSSTCPVNEQNVNRECAASATTNWDSSAHKHNEIGLLNSPAHTVRHQSQKQGHSKNR